MRSAHGFVATAALGVMLLIPGARAIAPASASQAVEEPVAGTYVIVFRTPRHVKYSSPEVFHALADDLIAFLQEERVRIVQDPERGIIQSEDPMSRESMLNITRDIGASHLLYIAVDRPVTKWVKLTVECFDAAGNSLWKEEASHGGGMSGKGGVEKTLEKLRKLLQPRMGGPGLPIEPVEAKAPAPAG